MVSSLARRSSYRWRYRPLRTDQAATLSADSGVFGARCIVPKKQGAGGTSWSLSS